MGRVSTVKHSDVYNMVGTHIAEHGAIKLQDIVDQTGISIGSLYHHYGSREELLALTWLDAVTAFQERFLAALDSGLPNAGVLAARVTPQFCRTEPAKARVLVCCRRQELISATLPEELTKKISAVNVDAAKSLSSFAKARGYALEACKLGLIGFPLGAVRLYLPHKAVPECLDDFVANAFRSAISTKV